MVQSRRPVKGSPAQNGSIRGHSCHVPWWHSICFYMCRIISDIYTVSVDNVCIYFLYGLWTHHSQSSFQHVWKIYYTLSKNLHSMKQILSQALQKLQTLVKHEFFYHCSQSTLATYAFLSMGFSRYLLCSGKVMKNKKPKQLGVLLETQLFIFLYGFMLQKINVLSKENKNGCSIFGNYLAIVLPSSYFTRALNITCG